MTSPTARPTGSAFPGAAILAAITIAALAGAQPARAEVWGLLIGIDHYEHGGSLNGAVNDARDLADALERLGAREVRVLIDGDANRDNILRNWREVIGRAAPGDTMVVSYAGHGSQQPEAVAGTETDGQDEFFLLGGFASSGPGTYERILDNEINQLLKESSHLNILFIADACHSGTMTRAWDRRAGQASVRYYDYGEISDDHLPPPDPGAAMIRSSDLTHVTFFAGVTDDKEVPEVRIDGDMRGALSWSVAEALRGAADGDGDGRLTKGELETYVLENVRMKTNYRQQAVVEPPGRASRPVITRGNGGPLPDANPAPPIRLTPLPSVRVHLINTGGNDAASTLGRLRRAQRVPARDAADLIWDLLVGEIILATGEVVAQVQPAQRARERRGFARTGAVGSSSSASVDPVPAAGVDYRQVQTVIDKWALNARLVEASETRSLRLRTEPDNRTYRGGERLTFVAGGHRQPYFTLFNLSADGTLNFLYPLASYNDPLTIPDGRDFPLELEPEPPYGGDHFVAIASSQPLQTLHRELLRLDGTPAAAEAAEALDRALVGGRVQLGVHAVFTGAR